MNKRQRMKKIKNEMILQGITYKQYRKLCRESTEYMTSLRHTYKNFKGLNKDDLLLIDNEPFLTSEDLIEEYTDYSQLKTNDRWRQLIKLDHIYNK